MPQGNVYRTDGQQVNVTTRRIEGLPAVIDSIKSTADGKLVISMSSATLSEEVLEKVRDLLLIQQSEVFVDFEGAQKELPL